MYLRRFGLERNPFKNAPGSTFYYTSINHKHVMDTLVEGLRERHGLHLVLGENGTGKTTLCRFIQIAFSHEFTIAYLGNPFVDEHEFLRQACSEFEVDDSGADTAKQMVDALTAHLEKRSHKGRIYVLMVDEAHNLGPGLFDILLVLANAQSAGVPLLQIMLCGLDSLDEMLAAPRMGSLNQRIGTRCRLDPLPFQETVHYIRHRLEKAGGGAPDLFDAAALSLIWKVSGGKPRLINHLSRLALENAAREGDRRVGRAAVNAVLADPAYRSLFRPGKAAGRRSPWAAALALALVAALGAGLGWHLLTGGEAPTQTASSPEAGAAPAARTRQEKDPQVEELRRAIAAAEQELAPSFAQQPARPEQQRRALPSQEVRVGLTPPRPDHGNVSPAPELEAQPAAELQAELPAQPAAEPSPEPPADPAAELPAELPADPAAGLLAPQAEEPGGRNAAFDPENIPATPPPPDATGELPPALAEVRLEAVAWHENPARRMAVLDGTIVRTGDAYQAWNVLSIGAEHVILQRAGNKFLLPLKPQ